MKSTRREFLKGIGIITAGTGLGALVASLPKPTYEVPNRSGDDFWIGNPDLYEMPIDESSFTVEGWMHPNGKMVQWDELPRFDGRVGAMLVRPGQKGKVVWASTDDMEVEWTHVPATKQNTFIIPPIW